MIQSHHRVYRAALVLAQLVDAAGVLEGRVLLTGLRHQCPRLGIVVTFDGFARVQDRRASGDTQFRLRQHCLGLGQPLGLAGAAQQVDGSLQLFLGRRVGALAEQSTGLAQVVGVQGVDGVARLDVLRQILTPLGLQLVGRDAIRRFQRRAIARAAGLRLEELNQLAEAVAVHQEGHDG